MKKVMPGSHIKHIVDQLGEDRTLGGGVKGDDRTGLIQWYIRREGMAEKLTRIQAEQGRQEAR